MPYDPHLGREIRETLASMDLDPAAEHTFDFYLYLPDEAAARTAAAALGSAFSCSVDESATGDGQWLCLARRTLIPDEAMLDEIGRRFEQLATEHNGEFDGWERQPSEGDTLADMPLVRLLVLNEMYEEGQYDQVIELGQEILDQQPDAKPMVRPLMAMSCLKSDRPGEAEAIFREMLAEDSSDLESWSNLGSSLVRQERLPDARAAYREALARDESFPHARYGLACCDALSGQPAEALAQLELALQGDPVLMFAANDDADFASLRGEPQFTALLARFQPAAEAALEAMEHEAEEEGDEE